MDHTRSRSGILVGLAAAAGAFGAAAMMSTAAAPTARADDFSDIISAVESDYSDGQASFMTAFTDFGSSSDFAPGLAAFFSGVDDDVLSVSNNLLLGSVEALTNEPISGNEYWVLSTPASFSDALTAVEGDFTTAEEYFSLIPTDLASGDYGDAAFYDLVGSELVSILPLEELLLGAAVSF